MPRAAAQETTLFENGTPASLAPASFVGGMPLPLSAPEDSLIGVELAQIDAGYVAPGQGV